MSYPRDLDELKIDELTRELMNRVSAQARGICDYCGREPTTVPCKFPERHNLSVASIDKITITARIVMVVRADGTHYTREDT